MTAVKQKAKAPKANYGKAKAKKATKTEKLNMDRREAVNRTAEEFTAAQRCVTDFMNKHADVFDQFSELVDDYNTKMSVTKAQIKDLKISKKESFGPFNVAPVMSVLTDTDHLDARVLLMDGVIKTVDRKVLESLVDEGRIDAEELEAATSTVQKTVRITGPKEIKIF